MTLTLQKVTIKINENRTFYLLERNVIRMKRRIQALTLALCFCTAFLSPPALSCKSRKNRRYKITRS